MTALLSDQAPAAIGPYSQAIRVHTTVYVSGQLPINGKTGKMPATIQEQTAQSIENIRHILEQDTMTFANVVKTTVYLQSMDDFASMNEVYASYFSPPYPARVAFQAARLPKEALVEIDAIACK